MLDVGGYCNMSPAPGVLHQEQYDVHVVGFLSQDPPGVGCMFANMLLHLSLSSLFCICSWYLTLLYAVPCIYQILAPCSLSYPEDQHCPATDPHFMKRLLGSCAQPWGLQHHAQAPSLTIPLLCSASCAPASQGFCCSSCRLVFLCTSVRVINTSSC